MGTPERIQKKKKSSMIGQIPEWPNGADCKSKLASDTFFGLNGVQTIVPSSIAANISLFEYTLTKHLPLRDFSTKSYYGKFMHSYQAFGKFYSMLN